MESKGKDLNADKPRQYNADLKISQYVCVHVCVPENFTFLILGILELFAREICKFLKK